MDTEEFRPPTEHAQINRFGIRCFRDTGDADYIAARLAMRAGLAGPFLWSAEQAVEKYLKCILFLNRASTNDLSHNLRLALKRINETLPFQIKLKKHEQEVFDHLVAWDADRYLLSSLLLRDSELLKLDDLVWKLRQYCRPLDVHHYADEPNREVLAERIRQIEADLDDRSKSGYIDGAKLELILKDRNHPAHAALVWKNLRYTLSKRKGFRYSKGWQAVNAPLWLHPELAREVSKWMKIPKHILIAADELVKKRAEEKRRTLDSTSKS